MEVINMGIIARVGRRSLKELSDEENAKASVEQNKAKIDYIAMMCDVEFLEEEEENDHEE